MRKVTVMSPPDSFGRVLVKSEAEFGSHGYKENWVKLQSNTKGSFITVNKKRLKIEVPSKGKWIALDWYGVETEIAEERASRKWVGETFEYQVAE